MGNLTKEDRQALRRHNDTAMLKIQHNLREKLASHEDRGSYGSIYLKINLEAGKIVEARPGKEDVMRF